MKINKGAFVKGGTSLAYKTGTWRDSKPIIDQEECQKCGICQDVCPDNAVSIEGGEYKIEYSFCKGCGICAYECTADAIEMIPEEK